MKPLLGVACTLPLMPQTWRAGLALFLATLDAITSSEEVDADFKAGKDL